jgi:hypothetical protein
MTVARRVDRAPGRSADGSDALVAVQARVAALEAAVDRLGAIVAHQPRRTEDPERDGQLLAALARAYGGAVFTVVDLIDSRDPELRAVLHGVSRRVLGSWLRRLRRESRGSYRVRSSGRDERGTLWALTAD